MYLKSNNKATTIDLQFALEAPPITAKPHFHPSERLVSFRIKYIAWSDPREGRRGRVGRSRLNPVGLKSRPGTVDLNMSENVL